MKVKIKNSLILILGLILILSTTTYAESFSDVKRSAWYYESVKELASRGGIAGYGDGSFKPNNPITFSEFLKMSLSSATGKEYPTKKGQHWVSKVYETAVSKGVISKKDFPDLKLILDKEITREDMTLILTNINFKIQGEDKADTRNTARKIRDIYKISPERKSCVLQAYEKGLIIGKPEGFDPKGYATRAEAAEVIMRMLKEEYRQSTNREPIKISIPRKKPQNTKTPTVDKEPVKIPIQKEKPENTEIPIVDKEPVKAPSTDPNVSIGNQILKLVNVEREKAGVTSLAYCENLSKVALKKSMDMATNNYFSHNSPTYGSPFDMMREFKINYSYAGENIAKGHPNAEAVVKGWLNSPGHRANILNSNFATMGIGYVSSNNTTYWTQMFTD